jgi:hypothetical protein
MQQHDNKLGQPKLMMLRRFAGGDGPTSGNLERWGVQKGRRWRQISRPKGWAWRAQVKL